MRPGFNDSTKGTVMVVTADRFETKAVEQALEVLALAYERERYRPRMGAAGAPGPMFLKLSEITARSPREAYQERMLEQPLAGALKIGIRELGEYLWAKTGSIEEMQKVLNAVLRRHPEKEGKLGNIVDKTWDGIGGSAGWIA
jgi:hypothetical protein